MTNKIIASIIIPTLNRSKELSAALESLKKQTYLLNIEIIIIDNGSVDNTIEIVKSYEKYLPIIYEYNNVPGLLTGRHKGSEIANGEILCFLDDDVELNPQYIHHLVSSFVNDPSILIATGPSLPNYEIDPPKWLANFWERMTTGEHCGWLSLLDFGSQNFEIDPGFVWGLNFCIRRDTFIDLGGFHPDCVPESLQMFQGNGETGLTMKATAKGINATYLSGLMLKHYVPASRLTIAYFKKRAFYQGVCDSFTDLRNTHFSKQNNSKFKNFRNSLHPYYKWIKKNKDKTTEQTNLVERKVIGENAKLISSLNNCKKAGYKFHQDHFKNNKAVRNWVLKENYWDYKLPSF